MALHSRVCLGFSPFSDYCPIQLNLFLTFFIPAGSKGIPQLIITSAPLLLLIPAVESRLFAKKL
jgi:hypothetical protein